MNQDGIIVEAAELDEGMEIFNGRRWLILEEAHFDPETGLIRLAADCGVCWSLDPAQSVTVASY